MGRYSFLDECPLISSTPETLYNTLSVLIKDQKLRDSIGAKSREFANCRHSYRSWQNLWAYFEENDFDGKVISSTPNASFIYQKA
jgi:endonuclease IV